jgi:hypothetical protein
MKKLITLGFIMSLLACESNERVAPYKDITGEWLFTGDIFSGSFKVVKTLDGKLAVEPPSSYTINGKGYISPGTSVIIMNPLLMNIQLISDGDGFIVLREVTYKADYTEMTSGYQIYTENCLINPTCPAITFDGDLRITRKMM